ncbi:MAG: NADP-dependent phosphogluconate dehydrogenase [Deltaproteobacteria bacterium]|nr:NADP-dependent phosphogluconate dehydrogenase [Deltaproteobacteria bacterium]
MESNVPRCDLALVGLGVMGANLALNFADHGRRVALFDREPKRASALAARHPDAGFVACESIEALTTALVRPRVVVLLVPAGDPVDDALAALSGWLDRGDVVVDAGNSLFRDTDRRLAATADRPWHFVGMGISGGSEGARTGPAMMPGGSPEAWERLRPLLEPVAASADGTPCVAWCGRGSAGHFVKMVHNGIEYGDMQLIAEIASLMRHGLGWEASRCADAFDAWNAAELESYLIGITARILRTADPEQPGALLLDAVLDRAGQKGTGRWTIEAALELGVAIPTITAAVDARIQSAALERRIEAHALFAPTAAGSNAGGSRRDDDPGRHGVGALGGFDGPDANDLRDALYAAKIASYSQGFELLARGSEVHRFGTDLASVARIWKAGCIIRARFLDEVAGAFAGAPSAPLLALSPAFAEALRARLPGWRRVVAAATRAGLPIPGLAASLAWFDGLVTRRGSADLIQAQRDYFGAHGYERVDAPGRPVHTDWANARRLS